MPTADSGEPGYYVIIMSNQSAHGNFKDMQQRNQDMSLYYESTPFLSQGSLKSQVFSSKSLKSAPKQVFALVSEATKWSVVLTEVIENSQLLAYERKVSCNSLHGERCRLADT